MRISYATFRLYDHFVVAYAIAVAKVVPSISFNNRVTAVNLPTCGDFELGKSDEVSKRIQK